MASSIFSVSLSTHFYIVESFSWELNTQIFHWCIADSNNVLSRRVFQTYQSSSDRILKLNYRFGYHFKSTAFKYLQKSLHSLIFNCKCFCVDFCNDIFKGNTRLCICFIFFFFKKRVLYSTLNMFWNDTNNQLKSF